MTRLVIDGDLCQGTGECAALAPDLITFDDLGIAVVRDPDASVDAALVRRIVATCPSGAITAVEG